MSARLDEATADRLARILGLLGSAHAGERASAAAKADALVREAGLMWRDVILPSPSIAPQLEAGTNWRRLIAECYLHRARLPPSESEFVEKILTWRAENLPKAARVAYCDPFPTAWRGPPMTRRRSIADAGRAPLSKRKNDLYEHYRPIEDITAEARNVIAERPTSDATPYKNPRFEEVRQLLARFSRRRRRR
jgi:hypothetical protein